ncbi:unnamed protein product [Dicrocoelium dendriticum]|nr:unnamed protein product [Dicrocoelium dendriticum]
MVIFSCTACNEPLRKQVVETHFTRCRGCRAISCMECHKDFDRDSYKLHATCISELGKQNKRRSAANHSIDWTEVIKVAIDKCPSTDLRIRPFLEGLSNCPNVPTKQKKFENFMQSKYPRLPPELISTIWNMLSTAKSSLSMSCCPIKQSRSDSNARELESSRTPAVSPFDLHTAASNALAGNVGPMSLTVLIRKLYPEYQSFVSSAEIAWTKHQFKQELILFLESSNVFDFCPSTGLVQPSRKDLSFTNGCDSASPGTKPIRISRLVTDVLISKNGRVRLKRLKKMLCHSDAVLQLSEEQILGRLEKKLRKGTRFRLSDDGYYVLLNENMGLT